MRSRVSESNAHNSQQMSDRLGRALCGNRSFLSGTARLKGTRSDIRVGVSCPCQQLGRGYMLFVDRDSADDAFGQFRMMVLQFGVQLIHCTARAGTWAEH